MLNVSELFSSGYFGVRREAVGGATVALRYFQGRNHLLTAIAGPEHANSQEMALGLKVTVQPRGDLPCVD